ncbi:tetratricopeptide repeat protein [Sediminispirochaeta bajacaliforniensis]|uniref:tetratricopeptide repeat protein n=1 Tax=Sediminispirochaeta bajacaliforniensis TaxID=148 RepID=UPI0003735414|nr:tetratricopeptide repeat protein [Sediminispirochaeta bajacaliforniensis]
MEGSNGIRTCSFPFSILLATVVLLSACSSLPKEQPPAKGKKAQAADFASFGKEYFTEGRYKDALTFFSYALRQQVLADNREGIIDSYFDIGRCRLELKEFEEARQAFSDGLMLAEKEGLVGKQARGKILLGEFYLATDDEKKAGILLQEASEILPSDEKQYTRERAVAYHDRGILMRRQGDLEKAEEFLISSLAINRREKAREEEANNLYMLASVATASRQYEKADELLQEALLIDRALERSLAIADDLYAIAIVAEKRNDNDEAYTSFSQCFMIYQAMERLDSAIEVLHRLSALAEALGDEENAFRYEAAAQKLEQRGKQSDDEIE